MSGQKVIWQKKKTKAVGTNRTMFALFGGNKPVKIRSYNSSNKYGLAVKNVKELLDKGCKLLKVRGLVIEQGSFVSWIPINRNSKKKQFIFMNYSFKLCLCWTSRGFMVYEHVFGVWAIIKRTIFARLECLQSERYSSFSGLQVAVAQHTACTSGGGKQLDWRGIFSQNVFPTLNSNIRGSLV